MTMPNTPDGGVPDGTHDGDPNPNPDPNAGGNKEPQDWEAEAKRLIKERDKYKKLAASEEVLATEVTTLKTKLQEYEQQEKDRKIALAKKQGDFEKIRQLMEEENNSLKNQLQAMQDAIAASQAAQKRGDLVEVATRKLGANKLLVDGLLSIAERNGYQLPEELDEEAVDAAVARIRSLDPSLFTRNTGGSPNAGGTPGFNPNGLPPTEQPRGQGAISPELQAKIDKANKAWNRGG